MMCDTDLLNVCVKCEVCENVMVGVYDCLGRCETVLVVLCMEEEGKHVHPPILCQLSLQ